MSKKRLLIVILLLIATLGVFYLISARRSAKDSAATSLQPETAPADIIAEAKVVPARTVTLSFSTGGVVGEIYGMAGARVNAGDPLVKLREYDEAEAAIKQAEANLRQSKAVLGDLKETAETETAIAESKIEKSTSALKNLQEELRRAEELHRAGILSAQALDQVRDRYEAGRAELRINQTEYRTASAHKKYASGQWDALTHNGLKPDVSAYHSENIRAAVANILAAQAALEKAKLTLADKLLRAPFSGIIGKLDLKVGEYIAPGFTVATLADLSNWEVETTDLTELSIVKTRMGAPVDITFDAIEGFHLQGHVVKIQPMGEDRHGDILYTVTVRPDHGDPRLQWNMTATVTIKAS